MRALYSLCHSRVGTRSYRRTLRAFIPANRHSVLALHSLSGAFDRAIDRSPKSPIASSRHRSPLPRTCARIPFPTLARVTRTHLAHTPRTRRREFLILSTTHPTARGREFAAQPHICIYMRSMHCIVRVEQASVPCSRDVDTPTSILDTHYLYANTPCDP